MKHLQYITDFYGDRAGLIGASDIPALIQHPETSESLAGYERTALTVYQEKRKLIEREDAGFKAKMGNMLEPLVIYNFIKDSDPQGENIAEAFFRDYWHTEFNKNEKGYPMSAMFQSTDYRHHTKAQNDFAIAHADCFKMPAKKEPAKIIESKARGFWPVQRRDDQYKGYNFDDPDHQGIPLADYYQVQFQMAMYQDVYETPINEGWLALLYDTNSYAQWHIRADRRVQERLFELASYMKKCIDQGKPPKMLAMNQNDIKIMYPKINEDFVTISGEELQDGLEAARTARHASKQEKIWKQKKEDAQNALAIYTKDAKVLKGIVDGEIINIAGWTERAGGERVAGVKEIKEDKKLYEKLKKRGFISEGKPSRFISVKLKED